MQTIAADNGTPTAPASKRMLWWFVALSVALHVLVLARWQMDRPRVASLDPTLDVTLLDQQAASTRDNLPSPQFDEGHDGRAKETSVEQTSPARRLNRAEQPTPKAPATPAIAQNDARPAAGVDKPNTAHSSAINRLTPSPLPASAPASTMTPLNRDELLQRIQRRLALLRDYPPLARRRGWEGDVHLTFRVTEHGAINAVRVALS